MTMGRTATAPIKYHTPEDSLQSMSRVCAGRNVDWWLALATVGSLFRRPLSQAQIKRTVDQPDMAIGLGKVTQHAPGLRIELLGEQTDVVAAGEQTVEQPARLLIAALQYVIVNEPKTAGQ
jgi:hypothetical protein